MLAHLGLEVPDLRAAKTYYDVLIPLLGFDEFLTAISYISSRQPGSRRRVECMR
jgi:hypothetical protein